MRLISGEASPSRFTNHNHSICRIQGRRDPSQATSGSKHAKARILPFGTSQALTPSLPSVLRNLSADCITSSPTQSHSAPRHASRALLLPEIVATILRTESTSPSLLHTCVFINKIFSFEACRILWEGCGARYNSATTGHVTPKIKHLARHYTQRAQFYTNFIHILMFHDEGEAR